MKKIFVLLLVSLILSPMFTVLVPRVDGSITADDATRSVSHVETAQVFSVSGIGGGVGRNAAASGSKATEGLEIMAAAYIDLAHTGTADNQYDFDRWVDLYVDVDASPGPITVDVFTYLETPNNDIIDADNYYGWVVQGTTDDYKWFSMYNGFDFMQYVGLQWHIEILVRDSSTYVLLDQKNVFFYVGPIMTDHFTCRDPYNAYATRTTIFYDTETAWEYTAWDTHNLWITYEVKWDFNGPGTSHLIAGPEDLTPGQYNFWAAGGITGGAAGSWYVDVLLDDKFRARDGFDIIATTSSVTVDPNGGRIYVDGSPITVLTVYTWSQGSTHTLDPDSGYSPIDGKRLIFSHWSDGNTADPRTITAPSGSATYRVEWQTQFRLIISVSPSGGGTTSPTVGTYWYNSGQPVTVSESPNAGYVFDHWDLSGSNVGSNPSYTVSMNTYYTLTAIFSALVPDFSITNPGTISISNADEKDTTITITSINGYSSSVSLSATGQPTGVSVSFAPNSAIPTFTSTMNIRVGYDVLLNNYPITITGSGSDGKIRSVTFSLQVTAGSGASTVTASLPKQPLYSLGITVDLNSKTVTDTGDYVLSQGVLTVQDPYTVPLAITLSAFGYSYTFDIGHVTLDNTASGWISLGGESVWVLKAGIPWIEQTTSSSGDLLWQLNIHATYQLDALPEGSETVSVVIDLTKSLASIPPHFVQHEIMTQLKNHWDAMMLMTLLLADAAPLIISDILPLIQISVSHFVMSGLFFTTLTLTLTLIVMGTIIVMVASPVDMLVVDPYGRMVGINSTGGLVNQIEGAVYCHNETSHEKLVLITGAISGDYRVTVNGTDAGEYNLALVLLNGTYIFSQEFIGYTDLGAINSYVQQVEISDNPSASAIARESIEIISGQSTYYMTVESNATISELSLNLTDQKGSFKATASSGSIGYCDIVVPTKVLNGTFAILANGSPMHFEKMENSTHMMIHFSYAHDTNTVIIDILVTIEGDLNGDRIVDMRDLGIAARAFGARPGDLLWDPIADINDDDIVDMRDIGISARNFGQSW